MIDLLLVKKQKQYDFVQDTPQEAVGMWLCTLTSGDYTSGYSYDVTQDNEAFVYTRIEQIEDGRIQEAIYSTLEGICHYLNNWFIPQTYSYCRHCNVQRPMTNFDNGVISPISGYQTGDLIRVDGHRNRFVSYVTSTDVNSITVDNPNFVNTIEPAKLDLMVLPSRFEIAIAQMINYDVFERGSSSGGSLQSETVGSYRYEIDGSVKRLGALDYPVSIANAIEYYSKLKAW
ncbi:MAG: hypothetical protein LBK53_09405 [Heliobacteriaceae bacterium]|jgi:hypothetical protein|nr:hypothetical protein [Heliobacteriaceae bacterium]